MPCLVAKFVGDNLWPTAGVRTLCLTAPRFEMRAGRQGNGPLPARGRRGATARQHRTGQIAAQHCRHAATQLQPKTPRTCHLQPRRSSITRAAEQVQTALRGARRLNFRMACAPSWMPKSKTPPTGAASANSLVVVFVREFWLRGQDLNLRPLGYEPNELPGCSTPRLSLTL